MAILSIQSHVVYGYVGNTAATFPLQLLGHDVWAVNTVEFSNHTGYGTWRGRVLGAELVAELVAGLEERGALDTCEAVLSGYLGDAAVGQAVLEAVAKVRRAAPRSLYCCDPVMGDYGRGFFVRPGIPEILRERIVPRADIVTPNQFELEALTGSTIRSLDDARRAIRAVHELGPRVVLVTSYHGAQEAGDHIDMLVSDNRSLHQVRTPKLPFNPSPNGAGDLTAALFVSHYLRSGNAATAMESSAASVYGILSATFARHSQNLCLISAQKEIINPSQVFSAFSV